MSYLYPITVFKTHSDISQTIEVTLSGGELLLDSKNANYSYGSLQRVLRLGLKKIGFPTLLKMEHILVLGVAGGSVIKTLTEEIGFKGKVTGVEIDKNIIEIANRFFRLDQIENLNLIIDDAFEFVLKTREKYDLIIIDIFRDTKMPNFLYEEFFKDRILFLLKENGFILFNTMTLDKESRDKNKRYVAYYKSKVKGVEVVSNVENFNEIIIIEKY
ncbi:MAG: methyltransferase domain-containing protein [Flavobacteriaceae bacterium]